MKPRIGIALLILTLSGGGGGGDRCQQRGKKSSFRHDKMSHFLRVKRLPCGWLPRSSLAFLLLYRPLSMPALRLLLSR